ncbi:MAG: tetratricopeptide repeat protein [Elusimicrobia bacterium]|nr:tetratricopeptide repeat protein [Elusimicrobiota bacterium]
MDKIRNTNAHYYLAKAYHTAGMFSMAIDEFDKALKFSPEYANIHYDLAKTYEKMGFFGNAAKEYKIALDINSHYVDAKESLAKLLSNNRDEKLKIKKQFNIKKIMKYLPAGIATVIIVSVWFFLYKPVPPTIAYYSIPSLHPSGITISDNEIWVCDWFSQTLYKHNLDNVLSLVKSYKLQDIHPSSIASGKDTLWVSDAFSKKIFQFDRYTLKLMGSFPAPATSPSAIFDSKNFLWTCDSEDDKIYKHKKDKDLTVIFSAPLSNPNPVGLYVKGKNIFVADADTGKVYRYFLDEKQKKISQISIYDIPAFGSNVASGRKISGLSMTADTLFLTSEGTGEVYKIPFKMLKGK